MPSVEQTYTVQYEDVEEEEEEKEGERERENVCVTSPLLAQNFNP